MMRKTRCWRPVFKSQARSQWMTLGPRHQGKNGYTTRIGNDHFAWFQTTEHKDRLNFLQLLHGDQAIYVIKEAALGYFREHKLPRQPLTALQSAPCRMFTKTLQ